MGGLVLRSALKTWANSPELGRLPADSVVFIATPHKGSADAVGALVKGESVAFRSRHDLRKVARTMPAVYELLPAYEDPYPLSDTYFLCSRSRKAASHNRSSRFGPC